MRLMEQDQQIRRLLLPSLILTMRHQLLLVHQEEQEVVQVLFQSMKTARLFILSLQPMSIQQQMQHGR
jgi:hypothetical protein